MTGDGPDFALWRESSADAPFTVCAFFTPDYRARAERLAASLDRLSLPYAIFESPSVHRSISRHGGTDMRFSKPRFIAFCLARSERPVLYVDCDLIFRDWPAAVTEAARSGADFAAFNWLAARVNDAWMPVKNLPQSTPPRYWGFAFSIREWSLDQLITSGGVQFWRATPATRILLQDWEAALIRFVRAPDDHALDLAFNRGGARGAGIRAVWLPADHLRMACWPYVKPVIDHPGFATSIGDHFMDIDNRFDLARMKVEPRAPVFPRDLVVDAHQGLLLRPFAPDRLEPVGPLPCPLFLDDVGS